MQEIMVKTHLIITDIHEEYHMKWCGKLFDAKPALNKDGMPVFAIVGGILASMSVGKKSKKK